jgi:hypothetical protein
MTHPSVAYAANNSQQAANHEMWDGVIGKHCQRKVYEADKKQLSSLKLIKLRKTANRLHNLHARHYKI